MFRAPYVLSEITQILFETFPDVMDNKGVTRGDNVKCVILYIIYICIFKWDIFGV
jgi:hypothetical protein